MLPAPYRSPRHVARTPARRYLDDFYKAMRLRCVRRVRPTYLRLVNIHDHSYNLDRAGYRYVSDIITPSLTLLAEMCPIGSVDIDAPKLNTYQVMRCFEWPVKVDSMDHITQRIITRMHPLVAMSKDHGVSLRPLAHRVSEPLHRRRRIFRLRPDAFPLQAHDALSTYYIHPRQSVNHDYPRITPNRRRTAFA